MDPQLDAYFSETQKWREEVTRLRSIILACGLTEEVKWGKPFYTFQQANIVVIWAFKAECALGFCKGVLLKDAHGILVKPGENTQAVRRIPFTSVREIAEIEPILKAYIHEAIEVEKAGLEVIYKKSTEFVVPEELQKKLDATPALKAAFDALTPGRQRGYILHLSTPKQSKTRESRVEKCGQRILAGRGLNDR